MSLAFRVAGGCLRLPSRLYDLFAIVLVSAGINVVTGAGGSEHEIMAFASGFVLALAGALVTYIKNRCETIARSVESSIALDLQDIARSLAGESQSSIAPVLASEAEHQAAAIDFFLSNPQRNAQIVAAQFLIAMLLTVIGVTGTAWSLYATENAQTERSIAQLESRIETAGNGTIKIATNALNRLLNIESEQRQMASDITTLPKRIETATQTANQQVVAEIAQLRHELALLKNVVSNNVSRSTESSKPKTNRTVKK